MKVPIDVDGLIALAERSKVTHSEDRWMNIAIEWMKAADEEINSLRKEIECLNKSIVELAD